MKPEQRFSNRVREYIKYRPDYPLESIEHIINSFGLCKDSIVAEVGSGTGKFSSLFNNRIKTVYGIEPNKEMREAAEKLLTAQKNFISVDGSAENTQLEDNTIDAVVCAQSFHWFDIQKAKEEFIRILKKNKNVALIWNRRKNDGGFHSEYELLLKKYANDYNKVTHYNLTENDFKNFYHSFSKKVLHNQQIFDFNSLCGRLSSSSYCPLPGEKNYDILFNELKRLFDKYQTDEKIIFEYTAEIYIGVI